MSKHTPKPWKIGGEYSNKMDEIEGSDGRAVAVVWTRRAPEFATTRQQFKPDPELAANARLIVAAPELLEACRVLLEHIEIGQVEDDIGPGNVEIARAAIEKATGE